MIFIMCVSHIARIFIKYMFLFLLEEFENMAANDQNIVLRGKRVQPDLGFALSLMSKDGRIYTARGAHDKPSEEHWKDYYLETGIVGDGSDKRTRLHGAFYTPDPNPRAFKLRLEAKREQERYDRRQKLEEHLFFMDTPNRICKKFLFEMDRLHRELDEVFTRAIRIYRRLVYLRNQLQEVCEAENIFI